MATFLPIRGTQSEIDATAIVDGQILFTTDTDNIYIDNGTTRTLYKGQVVDSALSTTSENPVQNKIVTNNVNTLTSNINTLTNKIDSISLDSVKLSSSNSTSDSIKFGIDGSGNYGYIKEGAATVTPFKIAPINVGSIWTNVVNTIDITTTYSKYANLTKDNFFFIPIGFGDNITTHESYLTFTYSYVSTTGILTVEKLISPGTSYMHILNITIYIIV